MLNCIFMACGSIMQLGKFSGFVIKYVLNDHFENLLVEME